MVGLNEARQDGGVQVRSVPSRRACRCKAATIYTVLCIVISSRLIIATFLRLFGTVA
jgi:hypothetical protein